MEKTLIILKPDTVQRRLCGAVISRLESKGLKIVGMKLMQISEQLAAEHYAAHKDRPFYPDLVSFMTASPVVVMALEGPRAIEVSRRLMGKTFGFESEPGTIRGDFGISSQLNLIHGSDSPEAAARELGLFFEDGEILEYRIADEEWVVAGD